MGTETYEEYLLRCEEDKEKELENENKNLKEKIYRLKAVLKVIEKELEKITIAEEQ